MPVPPPNPSVPFRVVHFDDDLIVVDKPAGVVTQPGVKHAEDTLLNGLFSRFGAELTQLGAARDFGLVHRLDRPTSGLLLIGRTAAGYDGLRAQFEARTIAKTYLALVHGRLQPPKGVERGPIREVRVDGRKRAKVGGRGARQAVTRYRTLASGGGATLVECHPETGRLHQIRAHLAHRRAPVVGDREYGPRAELDKRFASQAKGAIFLHAGELGFTHPVRGNRLTVRAPLPAAQRAFLATLSIECPKAWR